MTAARVTGVKPADLLAATNSLRWRRAALWSRLVYPRAFGSWGKGSVMVAPMKLANVDRIHVGRDCAIYDEAWLACEAEDGSIQIGNEVYLGHGTHVHSAASVVIGDGCVIGDRVTINDARHVPGDLHQIDAPKGGITLGRSVHVGVAAVILGGVSIGDGAIVGANSVVTKDVPAGRRWVGDRLLDD